MALNDIIDFLYDESQKQTLTRQDIERCVLLVHDVGVVEKRAGGAPRLNPFDSTNTWLAEMGYATWRKVLETAHQRAIDPGPLMLGIIPEHLEEAWPEVQHAWRAAAAAIRRRVVTHRLPVEEESAP